MDLDGFHAWLCKRGRERSANQYCNVVRRWLDDPEGIEARMVGRKWSPNYRRFLIACVRVWAQYTGDGELLIRLSDIKRPPPIAQKVREPFELEEWFDIREAIDSDVNLSDAKRLVCAIIALRGIRCGDLLRLTKREINQALKTGILAYEGKGERRQQYNAEPIRAYLEELAALPWHGRAHVRDLVCPNAHRRRHGDEEKIQGSAGRAIRLAFDQIAERLEMPPEDLYAHRFRHTYATYFLQEMKGDPEAIFKLQQQMGWAKLDTAGNYLRRSRRSELDEVESRLLLSGRKKMNVTK
jgi:integrase